MAWSSLVGLLCLPLFLLPVTRSFLFRTHSQQGLRLGSTVGVRLASHHVDTPVNEYTLSRKSSSGGGLQSATYFEITATTKDGISIQDITPAIREAIAQCKVKEGFVTLVSRHTTTAVMLNEYESRLVDDVRQYLLKIAPADYPYLHNDIHLRPATEEDRRRVGPEWDIEEWRKQEPKNCHSHLLSMLLGNTLQLPVTQGELAIGRWQSAMLVELDGPRQRGVGLQVVGFQ